jgi:hypothetical protein
MALKSKPVLEIPPGLLEAIRSFPVQREVEHCSNRMTVSPFDFYAACPRCSQRIKVRSFSAGDEIEDIFDAVFDWMNQPLAEEASLRRRETLARDQEDED